MLIRSGRTLAILVFASFGLICAGVEASPSTSCQHLLKVDPNLISRRMIHETKNSFQLAYDFAVGNKKSRSIPVSRAIQLEMGRRWAMGDPHALTMVKLKAKIVSPEKSPRMIMPTLEEFVSAYADGMNEHILARTIDGNQTVFPSSFNTQNRHYLNSEVFRSFKLGIDHVDLGDGFKFEVIDGEISHTAWTEAMCAGKAVFQVVVASHDFAHMTEYYEFPKKMAAMRRLYCELASGRLQQRSASHMFMLQKVARGETPYTPEDLAQKQMYIRILTADEATSLPDVRQSDAIRALFPELFNPSKKPDLIERRQELNVERRNLSAFMHRTDRILLNAESLLLRVGGLIRDPYNLYDKTDYENIALPIDYSTQILPGHGMRRISGISLEETLHYRIQALRVAQSHLKKELANAKPDQAKVDAIAQYIAHNLAKIEMAFYAAVAYEVTPEKLVEDITSLHFNKASSSGKYFGLYTEPGELVHWAFVESEGAEFGR